MKKRLTTLLSLTAIAATSLFILTACKVAPSTHIEMKNEFQPDQSSFILNEGNNSISGNAFVRQNDANLITCSGSEVKLFPVTDYSKERISIMYAGEGYTPRHNVTWAEFRPEAPKEFYSHSKKKTCNPNGHFKFKNIPNGKYYIQTNIIWYIGKKMQGGSLIATIELKNGKNAEIVMSYSN